MMRYLCKFKKIIFAFVLFIVIASGFASEANAQTPLTAVIPVNISAEEEGADAAFTLKLTGLSDKESDSELKLSAGEHEIPVYIDDTGDYRYRLEVQPSKDYNESVLSLELVIRVGADGSIQMAAFDKNGDKCETFFTFTKKKYEEKTKDFVEIPETSESKESEENKEQTTVKTLPDKNSVNKQTKAVKSEAKADGSVGTLAKEHIRTSAALSGEKKDTSYTSQKGAAPDTGDSKDLLTELITVFAASSVIISLVIYLRFKKGKDDNA